MNVLMISLNTPILTQELGDSRLRHMEYGKRIGHITMIVHSPRSLGLRPVEPSPHLTVLPTNTRTKIGFIPAAYRLALRAHRERPANLVTTQDPFATGLVGVLLKRRLGVALDVQNHSTFIDNPHWLSERPLRNRLFNALAKYVIRQAETNRVVNHFERQKYIQMGLEPDSVRVVPTPVRLSHFLTPQPGDKLASMRRSLGLSDDTPVMLWVGRPVRAKNLPMLMDVLEAVRRRMPGARLLLIGQREPIENLVREKGVAEAVIITGKVRHDELPAYYSMSDVFVLTSLYEGLPKVLLEAGAAALPAISTAIPGADEVIVNGETGYLVAPGDVEGMAERITTLLGDRDLASRMGQNARRHVLEKFNRERNIEAIIEMWRVAARKREQAKGG